MTGRPRKAGINTIVRFHDGGFGVVVDYDSSKKTNRYCIVRSDAQGRDRGRSYWKDSTSFTPTNRTSVIAGRIHRQNQREVDRGCTCDCCPHVRGVEPVE